MQCLVLPSWLHRRYIGKEDGSNMVIVEINMLSGFYPDPDSLKSVSSHTAIIQKETGFKSVSKGFP